MKNMKSLLIFILTLIVQFSGIILAMVLEDLSTKKMGVARYLVFKKQEFETTLFTPALMNVYSLIVILGAAICIVLLILHRKRRKGMFSLFFAVIANLAGVLFIHIGPQLQAYYFLLIGIFIAVLIQYIRILHSLYR
ncbi:MAG: hypothetical protein Q8934_22855 [Bacillota bacterium]|nr:hypothetical protein [Bacillota bacterium]